jgi:hypothetical protein
VFVGAGDDGAEAGELEGAELGERGKAVALAGWKVGSGVVVGIEASE